MKVLDTFSGAGGFSLGFHLAKCDVVGAIELDDWACQTFAHNHPESKVIQGSLERMTDDELLHSFGSEGVEVLLGGPPCQGFSICRKDAGDPADPRNSLFREFIRSARLLAPGLVVMENVPNLVRARTHDGELVLDIIKSELRQLGYHTYHTILEATNFGVPQIRRRLFVIGSVKPLRQPFPEPTHGVGDESGESLFGSCRKPCPTLWEAISDLPPLGAGEGEDPQRYVSAPDNDYQTARRRGAKKLFNHTAMNHTPRMVERFASMKCGDSVSDVAEHLRPLRRNGNGEISAKTYDQNNRRMHPDRPCHTIPASFYANFVHPFQHRNFTPREGARLQSFPDWYVFKGKPTVVSQKLLAREGREEERHLCQYNQIGNAVPPLLAKAVAENLLKQFEKRIYAHAR